MVRYGFFCWINNSMVSVITYKRTFWSIFYGRLWMLSNFNYCTIIIIWINLFQQILFLVSVVLIFDILFFIVYYYLLFWHFIFGRFNRNNSCIYKKLIDSGYSLWYIKLRCIWDATIAQEEVTASHLMAC